MIKETARLFIRNFLLVFLVFTLFMSLGSAFLERTVSLNDKIVVDTVQEKLWEKYPPIKIESFFGTDKAEIILNTHTEQCINKRCQSEFTLTTYEDGVLIEDLKFLYNQPKSYGLYILKEVPIIGDKIEFVCNGLGTYINGTNKCEEVITPNSNLISTQYMPYTLGEEGKADTYKFMINGTIDKDTDWIITTQNKELSDWAVWGSSVAYINLTYPSNNYISLSNPVFFNASMNVSGLTITNVTLYTNSSGIWRENQTIQTPIKNNTLQLSYPSTTSATSGRGVKFTANENTRLYTVQKFSSDNSNQAQLLSGDGTVRYALVSFVGDIATFNYPLTSGTSYILTGNRTSGSTTHYYQLINPYPIVSNSLTFDTGIYSDSAVDSTTTNKFTYINTSNIGQYNASFNTSISSPIIWNIYACASDGTCGFANENRTVLFDTNIPNVTILYPTGNIPLAFIGQNLTFNFSVTDNNLDSCWFEYDNVNYSTSCTKNSSFILTSIHEGIFYANDSLGNINRTLFNWDYNLLLTNQTYNLNTFETANEKFYIQSYYNSSVYQNLEATFYYNNTAYTPIRYNDSIFTYFNISLDIPINTNYTLYYPFYWKFILTNSTGGDTNYSLDTQYQISKQIFFSRCNSSISISSVNFTLFDENNNTKLNGTFRGDFNFWLGNGLTYKNYSYQELNNQNQSFKFCISQNASLRSNFDLAYTAPGYSDRTFSSFNTSVNNISQDINLFLLISSASTKFKITVLGSADTPIDNALVYINKDFIGLGSYNNIGIRKTDINGETVEYLELDKSYQFIVVKNGEVLSTTTQSAICMVSPCEIDLRIDSSTGGSAWDAYTGNIAGSITSSTSFNQTTKIFTYSFIDLTSTANYFRLVVTKGSVNKTAGETVCDSKYYGIAGSITCNLSAYDNGEFTAKTYISRSPEKLDEVVNILISSLTSKLGLMIIVFCIGWIITITVATASVSRGNPTTTIIGFVLSIISAKLMGLFPFSWVVVTLISLLGLWVAKEIDT